MPLASCVAAALLIGVTGFVGHLTGFSTYRPDMFDAYFVGIIVLMRVASVRYTMLPVIAVPLEASVLIAYAINGSLTLSYAVQVFDNPFQDAALRRFDHAIGFDYAEFMAWISRQDMIFTAIGHVYHWFFPLGVALVTCGLLFYRERQIAGRFYAAFVFAVILTCAISALRPAQGEVILLDPQMAALVSGASPLDHLDLLRAGLMHELPAAHRGIISFPSMHVGLGLLLIYYTRRTRLFYAFAVPSVVLILSAFTHGAHYLADGFAAVPVVVLACILSHLVFAWTRRAQTLVTERTSRIAARVRLAPSASFP